MDNESTPRLIADPLYRALRNAKRREADFNLFYTVNAVSTETVLARHDQTGPYSPENCYWREARDGARTAHSARGLAITPRDNETEGKRGEEGKAQSAAMKIARERALSSLSAGLCFALAVSRRDIEERDTRGDCMR